MPRLILVRIVSAEREFLGKEYFISMFSMICFNEFFFTCLFPFFISTYLRQHSCKAFCSRALYCRSNDLDLALFSLWNFLGGDGTTLLMREPVGFLLAPMLISASAADHLSTFSLVLLMVYLSEFRVIHG